MKIKLTDTGQAILALVPMTLLLMASKPQQPEKYEPQTKICLREQCTLQSTNQLKDTTQ